MGLASYLQELLEEVSYKNIAEDSIFKRVKGITAAFLSVVIDGEIVMYPIVVFMLYKVAKQLNNK